MPSDTADKFMLRFPPGLRDRIAEIARRNGRSMNAEIVARVVASLGDAIEFEDPDALAVPVTPPERDVRAILEEQTGLLRRIAESLAPRG